MVVHTHRIAPMANEAVSTYSELFDGLKERGLEKVDLIINAVLLGDTS